MTVREAREKLAKAIDEYADDVASSYNPNVTTRDTEVSADDMDNAIDALVAAVREESVGPAIATLESNSSDAYKVRVALNKLKARNGR